MAPELCFSPSLMPMFSKMLVKSNMTLLALGCFYDVFILSSIWSVGPLRPPTRIMVVRPP